MKIAIVVQGRFYAFELTRALLDRGHDVTLFTNYPKWAVARFGVPPDRVRSFWSHGVASRVGYRLCGSNMELEPERWLHPAFSRWAASQLSKNPWDVIHPWSGVSEEILLNTNSESTLTLIMRGSSHIRVQGQLLEHEETRSGCRIDRPGRWITAREEREYPLADGVVVLSTFAYQSFLAQGFERDKLRVLPLGTSTALFRPTPEVIEARCQRILSGQPLRILNVGTLSMRKGLQDYTQMLRSKGGQRFSWRFVGAVAPEAKSIRSELQGAVEFITKQPQSDLPKQYAWGDAFIFPTIEDGFPVVLAQAQAGGLPLLATTNSCAPDLIREGKTGWVLPIRNSGAFVERLLWCDSHREELAEMVRNSYDTFLPRDWSDVAEDFENLCTEELAKKRSSWAP